MKNLLCVVSLAASCAIAAEADFSKSWTLSTWGGYEPLAKVDQRDGMIHVSNVQAKYGFGMRCGKQIPARAGDTVNFMAMVRGRGEMFFQLQNFDAEGRWIGVAHSSVKKTLPTEWRRVTFSVLAENCGKKITAAATPTFGADQGSELFIKDTSLSVEKGDFAGDCRFPRNWRVFAPVPAGLKAPLNAIPEKLAGITGKEVPLNNNRIAFASFFREPKLRNTAWLYGVIESTAAAEYTIGASADDFMAVYVNGKLVIDTLESGDGAGDSPHFSRHTATVRLQEGENIVAIRFQSGSGANPVISLGGAEDLRNLSSVVTVTEAFLRDDYEQPGQRPCSPKLIRGILTDGIQEYGGQAVYGPSSVIAFNRRSWAMPAKGGDNLFATGIRIHKIDGAGEVMFRIGKNLSLSLSRPDDKSDFTMAVKNGLDTLKSTVFPAAALPADFTLAVSVSEYFVNAASLQDSKLRALSGKVDLSDIGTFDTGIEIHGPRVTVDEYFTGLAKREVKSTGVPFKVELDQAFDPVKAGWKLAWSDEFNGTQVDWEKNWMNSPWDPAPKNRDQAWLKDGLLHIGCDFTETPNGKFPFTGRTVGLYSQKRFGYGYYEARVRFTKKPGWWAAFWMLDEGRNMSVGGGYELDIFEDYSTRGGKPVVANNLHVTYGPNHRSYGYHFELPGAPDDFYVIGCKWTPFEVSHYLNGKLIKASARHSPYASATYDAMHHGFGTSKLYLCLSGQAGESGGLATGEYKEEYLVDYVRAYEYPCQSDPSIRFMAVPEKSVVKTGDRFAFAVEAKPSDGSKSPIAAVYLFDNGNLLDYRTTPPHRFDWAIDRGHYAETAWDSAGRSGEKPVMDGYPHLYRVAVQDAAGKVASTELFPVIADMTGGTPYQGTAPSVPGRIDPARFNEGGQNVACYKQNPGGMPTGTEKGLSRKKLNLREAGEWVNYSFDVKEDGEYQMTLARQQYRMEWPMRGLVLLDGKYIGDWEAGAGNRLAVLSKIRLPQGRHRLTLISACTYGVWPESIEVARSR